MKPFQRFRSVVRVFKLAKRVARIDAPGPSGMSSRALQAARRLALDAGAPCDDVDDATFAGLEAGRCGWDCCLLDISVPLGGAVEKRKKEV